MQRSTGTPEAGPQPSTQVAAANGGYFDAATACPQHPVARQAMLAATADGWADPGRGYAAAGRARQLLDAARAATASVLGVRDDEVIFCGSGTEAASLAVRGALAARGPERQRVVHSAVEHAAVLRAVPDGSVAVGVDREGTVDLAAFGAAVAGPQIGLAALISASHEVGTVQPVSAAAAACEAAGVPLYVDAAVSLGRTPVPEGWSIMTGSARKWGGPAGVGLLVVRRGTRFTRPILGPVNLPAVVGAAASLRAVAAEADAESARLTALTERIRSTIAATITNVEVVGHPVHRLPHIVTFSCLYLDGESLLRALDRYGFAVSSGSACTSDTLRPSHVLAAMGVLTHGNVRVSLHREVTEAEVDRFLAIMPTVVADLRREAGVSEL